MPLPRRRRIELARWAAQWLRDVRAEEPSSREWRLIAAKESLQAAFPGYASSMRTEIDPIARRTLRYL